MNASAIRASIFTPEEQAVIDLWFDDPNYSPEIETPEGQHLAAEGLTPVSVWIHTPTTAYVAQIVADYGLLQRLSHRGRGDRMFCSEAVPSRQNFC